MKKFRTISLVLAVLMLAALCVPFVSGARIYEQNPLFKGTIGSIIVPQGTPAIDGTATESEGWSISTPVNAANLSRDPAKYSNNLPPDVTMNVSFAQDAKGLYVAADIHDFTLSVTDDENYIDTEVIGGEVVDPYGINGDDFIFCYDPLYTMVNTGFDHSDYSCWYNIGFEKAGDAYKIIVFRTRANYGNITEQVTGAVTVGENSWSFEVLLPWDVLLPDASYTSFGQFDKTAADIMAEGAVSGGHIIYLDRAYNEDIGDVGAINRYATVLDFKHGGEVGPIATHEHINAYGIKLVSSAKDWTNTFVDVANNGWYINAVKYVNGKGLMAGTGANTFGGTMTLSRAMFITILGRMSGIGKYDYLTSSASDVPLGQFYTTYMEWALRNGIITADAEGKVYPNSTITREEIAGVIYNYTQWFSRDSVKRLKKLTTSSLFDGVVTWKVHTTDELNGFTDVSQIGSEYLSAMAYTVGEGVFSGSNGKLNPKGQLTRFEAAQVIYTMSKVFLRNQYDNLSTEILRVNMIGF